MGNLRWMVDGQAGPCMGRCMGAWWWYNPPPPNFLLLKLHYMSMLPLIIIKAALLKIIWWINYLLTYMIQLPNIVGSFSMWLLLESGMGYIQLIFASYEADSVHSFIQILTVGNLSSYILSKLSVLKKNFKHQSFCKQKVGLSNVLI